jgi:hypothetical protein
MPSLKSAASDIWCRHPAGRSAQFGPGAAIFLLVETQVREDAITLFGFGTEAERDWFRLLTSVQGVGGKVALAILGTLPPEDLSRAITLEDKAMIARAQGVGPRLAARITTELKGKAAPGLGSALAPSPPPCLRLQRPLPRRSLRLKISASAQPKLPARSPKPSATSAPTCRSHHLCAKP